VLPATVDARLTALRRLAWGGRSRHADRPSSNSPTRSGRVLDPSCSAPAVDDGAISAHARCSHAQRRRAGATADQREIAVARVLALLAIARRPGTAPTIASDIGADSGPPSLRRQRHGARQLRRVSALPLSERLLPGSVDVRPAGLGSRAAAGWQVRVSGKPPVVVDGDTLAPEVQATLALLERRGASSPNVVVLRGATGAPAV
jgi:hypothetical protein